MKLYQVSLNEETGGKLCAGIYALARSSQKSLNDAFDKVFKQIHGRSEVAS